MSGDDLFISDVHLDRETAGRLAALERFLRQHAARARRLFILGDLFHAWIGYKQLSQDYAARTASALRRLTESGVEVHFVAGNRDFYSLRELGQRTGMVTHPGGLAIDSFGRRVWLCHGHDLLRHDRRTHAAQRITHSRPVEWVFTALLPAPLAHFLGNGYQHHSSRVVRHKTRRMVSIPDEALAELFAAGHDCIVCGHLHRIQHFTCRSGDGRPGGDVYILGSWESGPHFLRHGPDGWHFHRLETEKGEG